MVRRSMPLFVRFLLSAAPFLPDNPDYSGSGTPEAREIRV